MKYHPQKLANLTGWMSLFLSLLVTTGSIVTLSLAVSVTTPILAQAQSSRKAEAEHLLNLCREHLGQEQFEEALGTCDEALRVYQEIKDHSGEAKSMTNLGIAYLRSGKSDQGISTLEAALEIARDIGEQRVEAIALFQLGLAHISLEQYQKGTEFLLQSLTIAQEIGETDLAQRIQQMLTPVAKEALSLVVKKADRLLEQGYQQFKTSQYQEAVQSWQQALDIYRDIRKLAEGEIHKTAHQGEATSLGNLGLVYQSLREYPKAIDYHQQQLAVVKDIGDRDGEADSLFNLGNVYDNLGQYSKAIDFFEQSLDIFKEIDDRQGEANSLHNLGNAYYNLGQYPKAINIFEQSLSIFKEIDNRQWEANSLMGLGESYSDLGEYLKAIDYFQQSLAIKREIDDRLGEADSLYNLGEAYHDLEQYPKAIDYYQQSLTIYQEIDDRPGEAHSLNNLGIAYDELGQYPKAINYYEQSLNINREINDHKGEAGSLNNLGRVYDKMAQYPKAMDYYQQSLTIFQEIGDRKGEGFSLGNLGTVYKSLGQYHKAIDYFKQSLVIKREIDDRKGEAGSLNNLGTAYDSLGQYTKAIDYYQQSLIIYREIGARNGQAASLNNLGTTYRSLGQYHQAIDYFQQSLTIVREIGDRQGEAGSLNGLSNAYQSLGQYLKAIKYYQQSLRIFQEIGDRQGEAASLDNLGVAYHNLGQYPKAIDYHQQSLEIKMKIGDRNGEARSLTNLGGVYDDLGQYPKAIDYHQQSLEIKRKIGDRNGEAHSLGSLGNASLSLGQYHQAIEYFQQSLTIKRKIGARQGEAGSLNGLGIAHEYLGNSSKAINYFQQSLTIFQEIGDRQGESSSLNSLGNVYSHLEQPSKAIDYYQQSLAIEREIGDREGEGGTLSNLGYLYEQQDQSELAIVFYKQSVIVREGIRQDIRVLEEELQDSYTETVAGTYRKLADLLLSQDRIYEAQQVLELLKIQEIQDFTRSPSARGELPKVVLLPQEEKIINSYGKLINFAAEIVKCEETNCPQISALRAQWTAQTRQYDQEVTTLESFIRQRIFNDVEQFLKPNVFDKTANRIIEASDKYNSEQGTVAIYPLILEDKLWLLWASQGEVFSKREITNVGRQQINQEVVNLRNFLQDPNSDVVELQKTAQQLYNWLIKPIEAELEAGEIKHLAFSLDRGFRYIPMVVLHDGEKYLIEKYTVTTFISAEFTDTVDRLPEKQEETPIIGLGASTFSSGYDPLPHVLNEIDSIVQEDHPDDQQGIYPGTQFLNKDFTFRTLQENLSERKLLHIATHADFVPDNQYESFLVLGDGNKLSIPDIKTLRKDLDDIHLVVLSACETALGDSLLTDPKQEEGIEINALSFYFLSGGAKTVMASLWRVDDTSTSQLMQRFYCTLANNPSITKAQALKQAQESLLNNTPFECEQSTFDNTDFTHPHYWAPFILIGNGL